MGEAPADPNRVVVCAPIAVKTQRLCEQNDALKMLCNEILVTFSDPHNVSEMAKIDPDFHLVVESWLTKFYKCSGEA
jgi:hypothetical protein